MDKCLSTGWGNNIGFPTAYPLDVIYPVDNIIHLWNSLGQLDKVFDNYYNQAAGTVSAAFYDCVKYLKLLQFT